MTGATSIRAALAHATERLRAASESPRLDAELLLARAIDMPRSFLVAHADDELDIAAVSRFAAALERRCEGLPMAYIEGTREFWSLPLTVSPATLVPRPETELLVAEALARVPREAAWRLLDLGTGSGAIALALARERPLAEIVATDLSEDALEVARQNARQLAIPNVTLVHGDWTAPLDDARFDLVVSNPPYVASGDPALAALVHEPQMALVAGADGLDAIRRVIAEAYDVLRPGAPLLLEHGASQQREVARLLAARGYVEIGGRDDLAGLPRVSVGTRPV